MSEEISINNKKDHEHAQETSLLDQSRTVTVLIGVLVILAGYLIYNYLTQDNRKVFFSNQPTTTQEATGKQDNQKHLGEITPEGDFKTNQQPSENRNLQPNNQQPAKTYTVRRGDTLWGIAENKLGSGFLWVDIARENSIPIDNPKLAVGQKLILPAVGNAAETSTTKGQEQNVSAGKITQKSIVPGKTYTVRKGDTLWEIARQAYGSGYEWVRIFNHPSNKIEMYTAITTGRTYPRIEVGQQIFIPPAGQI